MKNNELKNKPKPKTEIQTAMFTLFTAENNKPVSKRLSQLPDLTLNKQSLAYNLARAIAENVFATPTQFADGLVLLKKPQALAYGVMKYGRESAHVVTKNDTAVGFCFPGDINRGIQDFEYAPLPSVLMLDGDDPNFTLERLHQILSEIDPAFVQAPAVTRPSTSSCIFNRVTGDEIRGVTGFRLYLFIDDASLIHELVPLLKANFWLNGYGNFKISSSGSLLERFPIDFSVFQPNHLDYCAGAVCDYPLEQRLPVPVVINADAAFLDMAALIARLQLTDEQISEANANKLAARDAMVDEAFEVREQWISTRVQQLVTTRKISKEAAESVVRSAVETDELQGDFELTMQTGEVVTVAQLLANPQKYHGTRCCEPLEPSYHDDNRIAYISIKLGQKPYIYSHAHGGKRYTLSSTRSIIVVEAGNTVIAVDDTVNLLKSHAQVFDRGDQMVHVSIDDKANITTTVLEGHSIADFLGREIRYKKHHVAKDKKKSLVNIDPPLKICQHLESRGKQRHLKKLVGTTNVPFLRADGSVCDSVGYDEASGILFATAEGIDTLVNPTPTLSEVILAVELLWKPFEKFPFDNEVSRSTFFCALLTAAMRKVLETAPGIAIDAADAGSGKSLLAICLGILVSGKIPTFVTCPENDEEMRKKLTSLLLSGSEIMVFDNVGFKLKSQSLEAFLTARFFGDRLLGGNKMTSLLNNALFVANGNNFTIVGDLNRRLLKCRLDANMQDPHLRSFDLDPIQFVRENRLAMIKAALTIIRGALTLGANVKPKGSMASFEQWDGLVRKSVCWLATLPEMPIKLVDPVQSISANYVHDPLTVQVANLFEAWHALFGSTVFTSKLLIHELELRLQNPLLVGEAQALKDAFDDALSNKPFAAKDIGDYLAKIKDRVSNGLKLVRLDKPSAGYSQWQLITL